MALRLVLWPISWQRVTQHILPGKEGKKKNRCEMSAMKRLTRVSAVGARVRVLSLPGVNDRGLAGEHLDLRHELLHPGPDRRRGHALPVCHERQARGRHAKAWARRGRARKKSKKSK